MILENLVVTCGGPRNRGVRGGKFARERMVYRLVNFYHKILKKNPGQTCGLHVVNQEKQKSSKFAEAKARQQQSPQRAPTVVTIKITGLAGTDVEVAKVIANLACNPLTHSVDLVYSQEKLIEKVPVRQFQVRLKLRPGADVIEAGSETSDNSGVPGGELARTNAGESS